MERILSSLIIVSQNQLPSSGPMAVSAERRVASGAWERDAKPKPQARTPSQAEPTLPPPAPPPSLLSPQACIDRSEGGFHTYVALSARCNLELHETVQRGALGPSLGCGGKHSDSRHLL